MPRGPSPAPPGAPYKAMVPRGALQSAQPEFKLLPFQPLGPWGNPLIFPSLRTSLCKMEQQQ